ncbi:hypothetical protein OKW42_003570 [Paraburkholderia sp. WC7.3d]
MREPAGETGQQRDRGQRESQPRCQRAGDTAAHPPDRDADLAAARARQKLAQRDEVAERVFVEPAAALDELVAEIAQMRGRTAERSEAWRARRDMNSIRRSGKARIDSMS